MPEIVADPLSSSCYHLFPESGIQESQWLGSDLCFTAQTHARERSFGSASSGKSADVRCNPYLNPAADSLQIAQTVKDDSIQDCNLAGVRMRHRPPPRSADHTVFRAVFPTAVRPVRSGWQTWWYRLTKI